MEEPEESTPGIFASLGRLLRTVIVIAQNRLAGMVLILALMTLMAATIAIVVVCVRADRLDLVVALVLLYLAGTIFSLLGLRARLKKWAPFSATLAELKKDKACLDEQN
jgi:uncharacterized membrane protein YqjE